MSLNDKSYKNLKKEFIKSAAVLILALVLLVTAVVAWFTFVDTSQVSDFAITIETEDGGVYLGDDVAIERDIVLPAATKIDDTSISKEDFAKVMYIETFQIIASSDVTKAAVTVTEEYDDLHYYIDGNYSANDTALTLAGNIKEDFTEDRDKDLSITFSAGDAGESGYERTVAVVFWADFNTDTEAAIKSENGLIFEGVTIAFSALEQ